jgi:hypothetical protein
MFAARPLVAVVLLAAVAGAALGRVEPDSASVEPGDARAVGFPAGEVDSGADGRFFRVSTTAEPTALEAEEPFTFTIRITTPEPPARPPRRIDLNSIPAFAERFYIPEEDETPDDVFPAAVLAGLASAPFGNTPLATAAALAPQTEWVFVYRLKPKSAEVTEVPILTFAYHDPRSQVETPERRWHVPYAEAIPLDVRTREGVGVPLRAPDWAFRLADGDLSERREPWRPPGPLGITCFLIAPPLLGWCWYLTWRRLYPDAAWTALQRRSRSARRALELLARARRAPPSRRADIAAAAVAGYLRERLDFPAAEATPVEARSHLLRVSCSAASATEAEQFFRACDAARFQPLVADADALCQAGERLIVALEEATSGDKCSGRPPRLTLVLLLLAVALASGAESVLSGEMSNSTVAEQGRASFEAGVRLREASTRAQPRFREAARYFEELRRRGGHNPALYRNLGNAHLLADELGQAILAYRRGLQLSPRDPDLRAGLAEARKRVVHGAGTFGRPPAERRLWWLPHLSEAWLFAGAAASYLIGWAFLTGWLMFRTRRPLVLGLASLAVAAVVTVVGAVTLRGEREESTHPVVVIVEDGVLLLKGNGVNFPPRYDTPVNQGVEARLLFERDGWLQIELSGGEVGWVAEKYGAVARP